MSDYSKPTDLDDDLSGYTRHPSNSDRSANEFANMQGGDAYWREYSQLVDTVDSHKKQILRLLLLVFMLAILLVAMLIVFAIYPKNRYIATTDNKAICNVDPKNNPNMTDTAIADFAKDGVIGLYSFSYVNYMSHIEDVLSRYYSSSGRRDTSKAITPMVEKVDKEALTINAGILGAAKIEQDGMNNLGQRFWIVRYPMVIDVYSGKKEPITKQYYIATVRVLADTASALNPRGLAITSVTLVPTDAP